MLEFIVLGEIPGTNLYITFSQVLIIAAVLLIASELRIRLQRKNLLRIAQLFINRTAL